MPRGVCEILNFGPPKKVEKTPKKTSFFHVFLGFSPFFSIFVVSPRLQLILRIWAQKYQKKEKKNSQN